MPQKEMIFCLSATLSFAYSTTCWAESSLVWKCGELYSTHYEEGCSQVEVGSARGADGTRVFSKPREPNRNQLGSASKEDPRISGTLFSTTDPRPLSSASSTSSAPLPSKENKQPDAGCLTGAVLGSAEAAAKCGLPAISFPELANSLK